MAAYHSCFLSCHSFIINQKYHYIFLNVYTSAFPTLSKRPAKVRQMKVLLHQNRIECFIVFAHDTMKLDGSPLGAL